MVKAIAPKKSKVTNPQSQETNGEHVNGEQEKRDVLYHTLTVNGIKIPRKNLEFSCAKIKKLIGWETETEEVKFGSDYLLTDEYGKKIRCTFNTRNRPFTESRARRYAQDVLNRNWAGCEEDDTVNGETAIIGETGQVLSFQHRAIGFVLACQIWDRGGEKWKKLWPEEPKLYTLLVTGVSEKPSIVQTIDNVMPRTLIDVLYTSGYYSNHKGNDRKSLCRMTDYAIRLLWQRTGAKDNPFSPGATHSGCVEFLDRHPKVQEAVKHIFEENSDNSIGKHFSLGFCAGMLYLMATSGSDTDSYRLNDPCPNEKPLDWSNWDKATDFWVMFSKGSPLLRPVHVALGLLRDPTTGSDIGSRAERIVIFAKAWKVFVTGNTLTDDDVKLRYGPVTERGRELHYQDAETTFGGIDLGEGTEKGKEDEDDEEKDEDNPEAETDDIPMAEMIPDDDDAAEIEERKDKELRAKINKAARERKKKDKD